MSQVTITSTEFKAAASKGKTMLLKFSGQLDETNIEEEAKKVYDIMDKEKPKNMVFDFSELTYLNSKSIGFIADWQQKIAQNGGKLIVFGTQENIFDILDVVGLTNLIELVKTEEDVKNAL